MKNKGLVFLNELSLHVQGYSSQEPKVSFGEGCIVEKKYHLHFRLKILGKVYIIDVVSAGYKF